MNLKGICKHLNFSKAVYSKCKEACILVAISTLILCVALSIQTQSVCIRTTLYEEISMNTNEIFCSNVNFYQLLSENRRIPGMALTATRG